MTRRTALPEARRASFYPILLFVASLTSCVNDLDVGSLGAPAREPNTSTEAENDAATTNETAGTTLDAAACVPVRCRGPLFACGDCLDNDQDGLLDDRDPECFGPCDDDESLLGGRAQPCTEAECFFDLDCGQGNNATCLALTPNGCDCHGCCELGGRHVLLGSRDVDGSPSCSSERLDDPVACQSCNPDLSCNNTCESCELCFGGDALGAECDGDASCALPSCPAGVESCSAQCGVGCADGFACVTGCCADLRAATTAP